MPILRGYSAEYFFMKIGIALPQGKMVIPGFSGTLSLFEKANAFLNQQKPGPDFFELYILSHSLEPEAYGSFFTIKPDYSYQEHPELDLILIPSIEGDPREVIAKNQPLITWIKEVAGHGKKEVMSLCTGAFLLGEAGVLDGKICTTHWIDADLFQKLFPKAKLEVDRIIADDQACYTSGGAFSGLNLLLYYIRKKAGAETAIWLSKLFEINLDRRSQSQFIIFNQNKTHDDELIESCQEFIETHFAEKISVASLSRKFGFSRRNFFRRFKSATGITPNEYLQRVRIEIAKNFLETTDKRVYEVQNEVGYHDPKTFREIFVKLTGLTPKVYRDKYRLDS